MRQQQGFVNNDMLVRDFERRKVRAPSATPITAAVVHVCSRFTIPLVLRRCACPQRNIKQQEEEVAVLQDRYKFLMSQTQTRTRTAAAATRA
jgi:nucleoside phosphorylase